MKISPFYALVALTAFAPVPVFAAPRPLPAPLAALRPIPLLPADFVAAVTIKNNADVPKPPVLTRLKAPGQAPAFRVQTFSRHERIFAVEAPIATTQAVKKGDIGLARFSMRALAAKQESGEAIVGVYFQQTSDPYVRSTNLQLGAGPDWATYEVPFTVAVDSPAGSSALYFALGNLEQTVEIRDVELFNFGTSTSVDKLPATRFSYAGREAGAPWRRAALARIEEIRTAPIQIVVKDAAGAPVEGARVEAKLIQPAFIWGTAVESETITAQTPNGQIYRDKTAELFDTVVIGNGLKWQRWMGAARRAETVQAMEWIESKGMRLKGHTMVWPGWKFSPLRLPKLPNPSVELPKQIETRIEDIASATKGRIWAWDVVNEPIHERDFYQHFPETETAKWFKLARALDPKALLLVNEYAMLNSRTSPDFIKRYLAFIQMLKDNGAPLDAIGVQGHIGGQVRNPTDVLSDLDLLKAANLPIHITEFDINSKDEELQADYTRDFLIALYSHPSVEAFTMWGFWEADHWKPDAAMFRRDWSEKPNLKPWRDLILGQWRTKVEANTSATGEVNSRGHLGLYEVTVSKGTTTLIHKMQLTKTRGTVDLTLQLPVTN